MSNTKHTPTQWRAVKHSWSNVGIYCGNRPVASLSILDDAMEETQNALEAEMDADAAFIVTACNAYYDLRQDLSDARTGWEQATEAVREADEVREKLVAAMHRAVRAIENLGHCEGGLSGRDELESACDQMTAALAAAEAA